MAQEVGVETVSTVSSSFSDGDIVPSTNVPGITQRDDDCLMALNSFRAGCFSDGCRYMQCACPDGLDDFSVTEYKHNPAAFKADMLRAADIFEEDGL
jgi:hypothetical protein